MGAVTAVNEAAKTDGGRTWNDAARIAAHRRLTPSARLKLTIEASRAALRFADAPRRDA